MDKVLSVLLGTILGFFLSWIKEFMQSKPRVKLSLKEGKLKYIKRDSDGDGFFNQKIVGPENANAFYIYLKFDIFNIGKVGTGITDITIKLSANNKKVYYKPDIAIPFDNKKLENTSFNLDSNKVCTVETSLQIDNEDNDSFLFENICIDLQSRNRLKIEVIVTILNKKRIKLYVEPIAICLAY